MKRFLPPLLAAALLVGAAAPVAAAPKAKSTAEPPRQASAGMYSPDWGEVVIPGLWVRSIMDGVWLFTAQDDPEGEQPIASNGLLVKAGGQLVMIDTGWNAKQTQALVEWCDRMQSLPVRAAIVTHAHPDRTGGVQYLLDRGAIVEMLDRTAAKLNLHGFDRVREFDDEDTLGIAGVKFQLYYPGPGHTRDNIVVWIPAAQLLYAGSLVQPADAKTLGWIEDADLARWPGSLKVLQRVYRDALFVIPGSGAPGGTKLIDHTLALLRAKKKR